MSKSIAQLGQFALRVLGLGTSLVVVVVLARYLGPAAYGSLAAGLTLASVAYGVMDSGIFPLGVRRIASGAGALTVARTMSRSRLMMLAIISPIIVIVAFAVGGDSQVVLVVCALSTIPYAFTAYRAVAEASVRPILVGALLSSQNVAWLCLVIVAVFAGLNVTSIAALSVVACSVQALLSMVAARVIARSQPYVESPAISARSLFKEAWPLVWSSLAVTAYYRGSQLAVFSFASPEVGASYLAAFRLLDAAQVLPATLISVLLPRLVGALKVGADAGHIFRRYFTFALVSSGLVALATIVLSGWISVVLLGPQYPAAPMYLILAFCAFPFISGAYMVSSSLIALGHERLLATTSVVVALVGMCSVTVLAWLAGPVAAGFGVITVEFIHFTSLLMLLLSQIRKGWSRHVA